MLKSACEPLSRHLRLAVIKAIKGSTAVRLASMAQCWTNPHVQHTAVAGLATVTLSVTR